MDAGRPAAVGQDGGLPTKLSEGLAEARSGVGLVGLRAMGEQGGACGTGEALPSLQVAVQFPPGSAGERDQARLVELRDAHEQSVAAGVIVADTEPQEFAAPQAAVYSRTTARRYTWGHKGDWAGDGSRPVCSNRASTCCSVKIHGAGGGAGDGNWDGSGTKQSGAVRPWCRVKLRTIRIFLSRPWGVSGSSVRAQP